VSFVTPNEERFLHRGPPWWRKRGCTEPLLYWDGTALYLLYLL